MFSKKRIRTEQKKLLEQQKKAKVSSEQNVINSTKEKCSFNNKITEKNFEKQSLELLKVLSENKEKMSVMIIAELILEKIWYDKSFYSLYVKLCKKLWDNDEWTSDCYQVSCIKNNKKYY